MGEAPQPGAPVGAPQGDAAVGAPFVTVVGIGDDRVDALCPEGRQALADADVVAGGRRLLALWSSWLGSPGAAPAGRADTVEIGADTAALARAVRHEAVDNGRKVCVLASGDPGFFGVVRALLRVLDRRSLRVLPAPSSVSTAFARLGLPWDDAVVVSAHGRPLAEALRVLRVARKAAVLTSPESPPQSVGAALLDAGASADLVAVCSRLGSGEERVVELSLDELAGGRFDSLSVVVLLGPAGRPLCGWEPSGTDAAGGGDLTGGGDVAGVSDRALAWGTPEEAFSHRRHMVTKSEVRSVVLGKLALPARGVLWDVGAGSGSVAVECASLRPGLVVIAVEAHAETAARISANALATGVSVHVVAGSAPEALFDLPAPDRAFVGGGGLGVLDAVRARLGEGGRVVATFAALDRAAAAAERLGNLVEVSVGRGERLPDGGWRLAAQNPVFVAWGPET